MIIFTTLMRCYLLLSISLFSFLLLSAQINFNCGSSGPRILLAGDSWAQFMGDDGVHNDLLDQYGQADKSLLTQTLGSTPEPPYSGTAYAVSGSLARHWANTTDYAYVQNMVAALQANPSVEWVVLSIGGNDILAGRSEGGWYKDMDLDRAGSEDSLLTAIEMDTRLVIDAALAVRPTIKVLISSYEYPNFDVEFGTCWIYACDKREDLSQDPVNGLITNAELNQMMLTAETRRKQMADQLPRVFYDNGIGLMHYIYGSPNAPEGTLPPPQPFSPYAAGGDPTQPTLRSNFRIWGDPIHLDAEGYSYKVKNQMDHHFFPDLRGQPDATFFSEGGTRDGWVNVNGNEFGSNGIRMGDNGGSVDWRGILSFNTASLPDNAEVTGASIYLHRSGEGIGSNPYSLNDRAPHVDIKSGSFGGPEVEFSDGQASADGTDVGCFHGSVDEDYYATRIDIDPAFLQHINSSGTTQFRIYFDRADFWPNYVHYFDGSQQGLDSDNEERQGSELITYEEKVVQTTDAEGQPQEELRTVAAVAHNGLSRLMGTTAPFLDLSYELSLPVELLSFQAELRERKVELFWRSEREDNFLGYHIERSADGRSWQELGFVPGTAAGNYRWLDSSPLIGENYYRLKMEDLDGSLNHSSVEQVFFLRTSAGVSVFPVPFSDQLQIEFAEAISGPLSVKLLDLMGRPVAKWSLDGMDLRQLPLPFTDNLPAGSYWLRIQNGEQVHQLRVLKGQ
ncbi:MAG: hypothetical protein AAF433_17480 [Bacteroidota bacterium]